jgi:hypothetical protein
MLDAVGVSVIEGGFARVSEGDFQALKMMVKQRFKAEICSMSRAVKADVDAALKADVQSIVESWLKENGYDGLYAPVECACVIGDLMPCEGPEPTCRPGHRVPCPPDCGDHNFHIGEAGGNDG